MAAPEDVLKVDADAAPVDAWDDPGQRHRLGERLRRLRRMRGLTLQQVATEVDLSPSFLSMLERGQADVALSRLSRLSAHYGVNAGDLLRDDDESTIPTLRQPHEGTLIDRGPGVTYRLLLSESQGVQIVHVGFAARSGFRDALVHKGQDFCWITEGELTLLYGDVEYQIRAGQLVSYGGTTPHAFRNDGDLPAEMIGFINPPFW